MFSDLFLWGLVLLGILFLLTLRYILLTRIIGHRIYQAERLMDRSREKAIKILSMVLAMEKDNTAANWLMARIYYKSHHLILTRMYLNDILHYRRFTKEITEQNVRELLADTYRHMGEFNKALIEYFILKKQNRLSLQAFKSALKLNIDHSRYADARKFMAHALENIKETDGEAEYLMAVIDFHHADFLGAEMRLKTALERGYEKIPIFQLLGRISFIRAKYEDVILYFQKLPAEQLNVIEIADLLGQSFFFIKDYSSSVNILEKVFKELVAKQDRSLAEPSYILGCAYEAIGDLPKAIQIWHAIEKAIPYYQNAVHKLYFYNTVVTDPKLQRFIVSPVKLFREKCLKLLESFEFTMKQVLFENDRVMEFSCLNQHDLHPNYHYLVVITRETNPITPLFIQDKQNTTNSHHGRYLTVVAPMFNDEALRYAEKNLVTVYPFDIFLQKNILQDL